MTQTAALAVFLAYIVCMLWRDVRRRPDVSVNIWVVVAWVALVGSRPVSSWFSSGGGGFGGLSDTYDEGNPFERMVYFVLMFHAIAVLMARRVRLGTVLAANGWLLAFFTYWALSILWADLPVVALKRWVKDIGNILMVLVVLTDRNPIDATKAVFVRCAAVLLPMSVLFIRFYSDLGRTYHVASGEMMYTGVTTHKNSLGMLVLVAAIFMLWDMVSRARDDTVRTGRIGKLLDGSLLLMAAMLLVQSGSATALVCGVIGAGSIVALRSSALRRNIRRAEIIVLVLIVLGWTLNSTFDISGFIIEDILGRDRTLTTRTDVWPMLIALNENPLVGAGFNSFWSGDRLEIIYNQLFIFQAHNGYLETYLNGGWLGVLLLAAVLLSALRSINRDVIASGPFSAIRFAMYWVVVVNNLTEASFNKMGILWFALLMVIVLYPAAPSRAASARPQADPLRPSVVVRSAELGGASGQPNTNR